MYNKSSKTSLHCQSEKNIATRLNSFRKGKYFVLISLNIPYAKRFSKINFKDKKVKHFKMKLLHFLIYYMNSIFNVLLKSKL